MGLVQVHIAILDGKRVANHGPVKKYMDSLNGERAPVLEEHPVPIAEQMEEEMFLGLRKTEGVSL